MRRWIAWRVRNNPLEIDLFERSSQSPDTNETDTTETNSNVYPTKPVEMARNDDENARKCLSDCARPVLQRLVTRIHAPLTRGANFRMDSDVMSMLPIFHGKPSEDPYKHVDELSQVCEINHLQNFPVDTMKMKLFPATLRDRAKDWFLKLGKEFISWNEMEEEFLKKYYFVGKTTSVQIAIREFTQVSSETFHKAWERLRDLTREYPHHGVSNHKLTQIFYDGLGPWDRYLLDAASDGTFTRANTKTTRGNSSKRWQKIVTTTRRNHLEEVQCQNLSTPNQGRQGCSLKESTKWRKSRTYYWTDSTSATVPKDSPPSHFKKRHHVQLAQDSTMSN